MDKEFTLVLSTADMNILNEGLVGLPYYKVTALMAKINSQIQAEQTLETEED